MYRNLTGNAFLTLVAMLAAGAGSQVQGAIETGNACSAPDGVYTLEISGTCPGTVTVRWSGATPHMRQALVSGLNDGSSTIPEGLPCGGTVLGIAGNVIQIGSIFYTGNSGSGSIIGEPALYLCGHYIQLVEGGTCNTSNVAQIP